MPKDQTSEIQASEATDEAAIERELNEQQRIRREKLAKLQAEGRDPFAVVKFGQSHHSAEIKVGLRMPSRTRRSRSPAE